MINNLIQLFFLLLHTIFLNCQCTWNDGQYQYDLSSLTLATTDYSVVDSGAQTYYFNICADTNTVVCTPGSPVCQLDANNDTQNLGLLSTQEFKEGEFGPGTGVELSYSGGVDCGYFGDRKSNIYVTCDLASTTPVVTKVDEPVTCTYSIHMNSSVACPTTTTDTTETTASGSTATSSSSSQPTSVSSLTSDQTTSTPTTDASSSTSLTSVSTSSTSIPISTTSIVTTTISSSTESSQKTKTTTNTSPKTQTGASLAENENDTAAFVGAIAGLVCAVVILVALLSGVVWYYKTKIQEQDLERIRLTGSTYDIKKSKRGNKISQQATI